MLITNYKNPFRQANRILRQTLDPNLKEKLTLILKKYKKRKDTNHTEFIDEFNHHL